MKSWFGKFKSGGGDVFLKLLLACKAIRTKEDNTQYLAQIIGAVNF